METDLNTENKSDKEVTTSPEVKAVVQELLHHGYIDSEQKAAQYQCVLRNLDAVNAVLEPLDFKVQVDDVRGLLVLRIAERVSSPVEVDAAWSHPLVRRQRLTLEQSLLVAILRRHYVVQETEVGIGMSDVRVPVDDLVADMQAFIGDSGSDHKNERRVLTLLDKLKDHGLVSEPDKNHEVTIRSLIFYLANPENLTLLLEQYKKLAKASTNNAEIS